MQILQTYFSILLNYIKKNINRASSRAQRFFERHKINKVKYEKLKRHYFE